MDDFDYVPSYIPAASTSTAAPKLDRKVRVKKEIEREPQRVPFTEAHPIQAMVLVTIVCAIIFSLASGVIYQNKQIVKNNEKIQKIQTEIKTAEAEKTRLEYEFKKMYSEDVIREYAESVGMQQIERYQVHYFEGEQADRVIVTNGRAVFTGNFSD